MQPIVDMIVTFLPRLAVAFLIFIGFWIAGRFLGRFTHQFGNRRGLSPDVVNLMGQLSVISMLFIGTVTAFGTVGINVAAMIAGLGLVGFALGFALKDLLSNFLAGFLILMYHPFGRGDHITVGANEGRVVEINMRYTVLNSEDRRILIPNSILFSNAVIVQKEVPAPPGGIEIGQKP